MQVLFNFLLFVKQLIITVLSLLFVKQLIIVFLLFMMQVMNIFTISFEAHDHSFPYFLLLKYNFVQ